MSSVFKVISRLKVSPESDTQDSISLQPVPAPSLLSAPASALCPGPDLACASPHSTRSPAGLRLRLSPSTTCSGLSRCLLPMVTVLPSWPPVPWVVCLNCSQWPFGKETQARCLWVSEPGQGPHFTWWGSHRPEDGLLGRPTCCWSLGSSALAALWFPEHAACPALGLCTVSLCPGVHVAHFLQVPAAPPPHRQHLPPEPVRQLVSARPECLRPSSSAAPPPAPRWAAFSPPCPSAGRAPSLLNTADGSAWRSECRAAKALVQRRCVAA